MGEIDYVPEDSEDYDEKAAATQRRAEERLEWRATHSRGLRQGRYMTRPQLYLLVLLPFLQAGCGDAHTATTANTAPAIPQKVEPKAKTRNDPEEVSAHSTAKKAGFIDTTTVWRDTTGETFPNFSCSIAGGHMVQQVRTLAALPVLKHRDARPARDLSL